MWLLFLAAPALAALAYWLYVEEWNRWRYGYYHIHQAVFDLRHSDARVRWHALDNVSNVRLQEKKRTKKNTRLNSPVNPLFDRIITSDRHGQQRTRIPPCTSTFWKRQWIFSIALKSWAVRTPAQSMGY
jgi:hypothetical protein